MTELATSAAEPTRPALAPELAGLTAAEVADRRAKGQTNDVPNPTSRVISSDDLRFIAERLSRSNAYILADEIYRDLYFDQRAATVSEFSDKVIIISGLSKMMSMMTGSVFQMAK